MECNTQKSGRSHFFDTLTGGTQVLLFCLFIRFSYCFPKETSNVRAAKKGLCGTFSFGRVWGQPNGSYGTYPESGQNLTEFNAWLFHLKIV